MGHVPRGIMKPFSLEALREGHLVGCGCWVCVKRDDEPMCHEKITIRSGSQVETHIMPWENPRPPDPPSLKVLREGQIPEPYIPPTRPPLETVASMVERTPPTLGTLAAFYAAPWWALIWVLTFGRMGKPLFERRQKPGVVWKGPFVRSGYQPESGGDSSNPPQGGSGVSTSSTGLRTVEARDIIESEKGKTGLAKTKALFARVGPPEPKPTPVDLQNFRRGFNLTSEPPGIQVPPTAQFGPEGDDWADCAACGRDYDPFDGKLCPICRDSYMAAVLVYEGAGTVWTMADELRWIENAAGVARQITG